MDGGYRDESGVGVGPRWLLEVAIYLNQYTYYLVKASKFHTTQSRRNQYLGKKGSRIVSILLLSKGKNLHS
jgi:hypothetical protein